MSIPPDINPADLAARLNAISAALAETRERIVAIGRDKRGDHSAELARLLAQLDDLAAEHARITKLIGIIFVSPPRPRI